MMPCRCRKLKLEHIDGVGRRGTRYRAQANGPIAGTPTLEPQSPIATIGNRRHAMMLSPNQDPQRRCSYA
jgi:hypothetical protein